MKLNFHGVFGTVAVLGMFVAAYLRGWNIPWWYLVGAVILYAAGIIATTLYGSPTTYQADLALVVGCHCAFLLLIGGLLLGQQDPLINLAIFVICVFVGLAISQLIFADWHIFGILGLVLMVAVAFFKHWNIPWLYFAVVLLLYAFIVFRLTFKGDRDFTDDRVLWGLHLALFFGVAGMLIDVEHLPIPDWWMLTDLYHPLIYLGLVVASFAAGLAIPFMVLRER